MITKASDIFARHSCDKNTIQLLLGHEADPNGPQGGADYQGHSLRLAVGGVWGRGESSEVDLAVMEILLEHGADVKKSRGVA